MYLRELKIKDASRMLSWMHDDSITCNLATDFSKKTMDDVKSFIKNSHDTIDNIHLAS